MERIEGNEKDLMEEIRELRKLRTAVMVEKCLSRNEAVMCPKPRRQCMSYLAQPSYFIRAWNWLCLKHRLHVDHADPKVVSELSDIFISKASPTYYSGSPPIRSNNPLIQDIRFREQSVQQSPNFGVWIDGLDTVVDRNRRTQSIPTMA